MSARYRPILATLSREALEAVGGVEAAEAYLTAQLAQALQAHADDAAEAFLRELIEGAGTTQPVGLFNATKAPR